jgi:hypothetical protein
VIVRTTRFTVVVLLVVLGVALPAATQTTINLSGTWTLGSSFTLPELQKQLAPCVFNGAAVIQQDGSEIFGRVIQTLVSGPEECPAEMLADLSGSYNPVSKQVSLQGSMDGGTQFGMASFGGEISPEQGGGGESAVEQGPFAGASGTWTAVLTQQGEGIPVATPVGLTLLVLVLLAVGSALLRQQRLA